MKTINNNKSDSGAYSGGDDGAEWNKVWEGSDVELKSGKVPYLDVLKRIHREINPRFYLEIGVQSGKSLLLSTAPAIGVDPDIDLDEGLPEHITIARKTSDAFFAEPPPDLTIDLAFIDGMHWVEFALRDFINVERFARPGSMLLLDDIFPNHPVQAERARRSRVWTGDVWKLSKMLAALRPDLFICALDTHPSGMLVVAGLDPSNQSLSGAWDLFSGVLAGDTDPPDEVKTREEAVDPSSDDFARLLGAMKHAYAERLDPRQTVENLRAVSGQMDLRQRNPKVENRSAPTVDEHVEITRFKLQTHDWKLDTIARENSENRKGLRDTAREWADNLEGLREQTRDRHAELNKSLLSLKVETRALSDRAAEKDAELASLLNEVRSEVTAFATEIKHRDEQSAQLASLVRGQAKRIASLAEGLKARDEQIGLLADRIKANEQRGLARRVRNFFLASLDRGRNREARRLVGEAKQARKAGNWSESIGLWQRSIDRRRGTAPANTFLQLSRAHRKLKDFEAASVIADRGRRDYPRDMRLVREAAEIASALKDWPRAAVAWQEVLDSLGNRAPASVYVNLSRALRRARNFDAAEDCVVLGRSHHRRHLGLACEHAEIAMARHDWRTAVNRWSSVFSEFPKEAPPGASAQMARTLRLLGEVQRAEAVVTEAGERDPGHAGLAVESAETATALEDWPVALTRWEHVRQRHADREDMHAAARINGSLIRRICDSERYRDDIERYRSATDRAGIDGSKVVIYTAISGNYDALPLHDNLDPRFEYVLFSDHAVADTGLFSIRPLTYFDADPTRAARYVKLHPHVLLGEFDIAIWMDANILVCGDIENDIQAFLASGKSVAAVPHPLRKTLSEEFDACRVRHKETESTLAAHREHYRAIGFDTEDLIESNFMMFRLGDQKARDMLTYWWTEIDTYSKRDQLSLGYAIEKAGIDWHRITERPNSARNHPALALASHSGNRQLTSKLISEMGAPFVDPFADGSYAEIRPERVARQADRKVDVVVCVHNALKETGDCLESVADARAAVDHRILIVDDGSDPATQAYLSEFVARTSNATLLRNEEPQGYTRAANRGLDAAEGDLVVLLNSDTLVAGDWVAKMADAVFSTDGAGIVGPLSNAASYQSVPDFIGADGQTAINALPHDMSVEDMDRACERWTSGGLLPRVPLVHGFCFGVTRDTIDTIGGFDEESYPKGYGEENDYCFRAVDAGIGLVLATHTYVYHAKSASYGTRRGPLAKSGGRKLRETYGEDRVKRAVTSMAENPFLQRIRQAARQVYQ